MSTRRGWRCRVLLLPVHVLGERFARGVVSIVHSLPASLHGNNRWKGGRSSKLEGSDHIPVYMILNGIPELPAHNTPPSAARYLPEIRGRQQSIVSFLSKGKLCEAEDGPGLNISRDRANESCCSDDLERRNISKEELATGITEFSKGVNQSSPTSKRRNLDHWINEGSSGSSQNSNVTLLAAQGMKTSFSGVKSMSNKKNKHNLPSQPTIKSFFRRPETKPGDANINSLASSVDTVPSSVDTVPKMDELCSPKDDSLQENIQCTAAADGDPDNSNISSSLSTDKCNIATLEWQRIQQRMKMTLPLCKGHREPCIPRSVKKGSNIGRLFYVCARAQGPSSNPEANCNHFQWASVKSKEKRQ